MLESIIENLDNKIKSSLKSTDLKSIFSNLDEIERPTLVCGVGGSHVVSVFLEKVLFSKNNIIVKNIDPEEYFMGNYSNYENIILVSHTGKNHGIKCLAHTDKRKYMITCRKSNIADETILRYTILDKVKSYISIESTFIPLSILLCYYLGKDLFSLKIDKNTNYDIAEFDSVNIIYDYSSKTCATFLESSLIEAGSAPVTMHTKYNFCHGRSNIVNNQKSLVIYLITKRSELDETLLENIPKICDNFVVLEEDNDDPIVADFMLTIKALYFLNYLNKEFKQEFITVKYSKIVPRLYHYKGDLS